MPMVTVAGPRRRRASKVGIAAAILAVTTAGLVGGAGSAAAASQAASQAESQAASQAESQADPPATPAPLEQVDVDAWLDEQVPAALAREEIAGAVVAVVHDGEILTARGYGQADTGADGGDPVAVDPEQTLFRPGSVSKLVTATAVMQLVERGELDLDTDVSRYLDFDLPREYDADLTLRHLLSHTGGFEERIAGLIGEGDVTVDLRASLVNNPPRQLYAPGTVPAYSNYGSGLAGYIVERVSGMPFDDYVEANVFTPAGMTSSTFRQPLPAELADRMSRGYATASDPASPFEVVGVPPAGSLSAPATDMARFMLAHLGELPDGQALLADQTRRTMHTAALDEGSLGSLAAAPRMTLGFFEEDRNGHRIIGHGGDTNLFHSHLQLYPDERTGIYLSVNSTGVSALDTHVMRESLLHGFADRYFPADADPAPTSVDETAMRGYAEAAAGTYTAARGFQTNFLSATRLLSPVEVTALEDGRLRFDPDPGTFSPAVYEAVSPTLWREVDGQRTMAMRVVDGEVTAIAHDSAFTLVPVETAEKIALPMLAGSLIILVITALAWPIAAVIRRLRRRPAPDPRGRLARTLTRVAVVSALLAVLGWVTIIATIMGLQDVPAAAIRAVQALQVIGVAGQVGALIWLINNVRYRRGWMRIVGSLLVLLALGGLATFAFEFNLIAPSISY